MKTMNPRSEMKQEVRSSSRKRSPSASNWRKKRRRKFNPSLHEKSTEFPETLFVKNGFFFQQNFDSAEKIKVPNNCLFACRVLACIFFRVQRLFFKGPLHYIPTEKTQNRNFVSPNGIILFCYKDHCGFFFNGILSVRKTQKLQNERASVSSSFNYLACFSECFPKVPYSRTKTTTLA